MSLIFLRRKAYRTQDGSVEMTTFCIAFYESYDVKYIVPRMAELRWRHFALPSMSLIFLSYPGWQSWGHHRWVPAQPGPAGRQQGSSTAQRTPVMRRLPAHITLPSYTVTTSTCQQVSSEKIRVADPDPLNLNCRIQIQEGKNDPQKKKKVKKFHVLNCWMVSFKGWRLLLQLGRPL